MATLAGRFMTMVDIYDDYLGVETVVFVPTNLPLIAEYAEAIAEIEEERRKKADDSSGAV